MADDNSEFSFDLSPDDEQLLIQLATDAEARDSVAVIIDALAQRDEFAPDAPNENGVLTHDDAAGAITQDINSAAAAVLLSNGAEMRSPALKRALDDVDKNIPGEPAHDPAAETSPAKRDLEDGFEDYRSPLLKYRTFPRRPLTVSDLTSGAWCELQYSYTLSRLPGGRRTRTAAMKEGSKLHQKLEDEVHTTVQVEVLSREDGFGLKLWNLIHGLRSLRETGLTRELEIWGFLDGNLVNGVIDSLSHENPDPEFEFELSQEDEDEGMKQSKLTDFFNVKSVKKKPKVYLADVKTRGSLRKPSNALVRPAKIQLLLYHRFLSDLASGRLKFHKVFGRYGLHQDEPFSDAFIAQMADMYEEMFDETPSSTWQTIEENAELCSSAVSVEHKNLRYKTLRELLSLVDQEVKMTFPDGADSMGNLLRVQYIYREDGREIGHHDFAVSHRALDEYLSVYMEWWRGERHASGVSLEESFKCRMCEFVDVCTWREDMDSKRVKRVQERLRATDALPEETDSP